MKINVRILSKLAMLLVVFGFFMPMSCDFNGFQIADHAGQQQPMVAILLYIIFFSALISVASIYYIVMKKNHSIMIDFALLVISVISGLYLYFSHMYGELRMQIGCYFIIMGWIISGLFMGLFLIESRKNIRETSDNQKDEVSDTRRDEILMMKVVVLGILFAIGVLIVCFLGLH